jgi:hypothetical protein
MRSEAVCRALAAQRRLGGGPLRAAFLGPRTWLANGVPEAPVHGFQARCFLTARADTAGTETLRSVRSFAPHVVVVFDPAALPTALVEAIPGLGLGVIVDQEPSDREPVALPPSIVRRVAFSPRVPGERHPGGEIWRSIPPPVGDRFFKGVRPLHAAPRPCSIGRSTEHREWMLMPAKHENDLLQAVHGVEGADLEEVLDAHDVGVHVAARAGGPFGPQVGLHLAAGQLLLSEALEPAHGLEHDIDYLQFDSPDSLVWMLDRLGRFPEMYQRVRVRGRMKAEQYRASTLFAQLTGDLLADVSAFG